MFENLKAFIRHGRQANDMKRVNPSNPPYTSATENPFGSGYQIIDGTNDFGNNSDESPSDLQYQQYQQQFEQQQQQQQPVANAADANGGYAYGTTAAPQQQSATTAADANANIQKSHPIQSQNNNNITNVAKYSKKSRLQQQSFNQDLYSPAAVALRDAFDISTAVHRMGEEAALSNKQHGVGGGGLSNVEDLIEEEEEENEEDVTGSGRVLHHHYDSNNNNGTTASSSIPRSNNRRHRHNHHREQQNLIKPKGGFDLNLGGASIIERRKNKQIPIQSS
ncbi:unnamed protein product [Candida parapsilosis]